MLKALLDKKDSDTMAILSEYHSNEDSEFLITSLEQRTEDEIQAMLNKNFSNSEAAKFRTMRGRKDEALLKAFKKFERNQFDVEKLVRDVKKIL